MGRILAFAGCLIAAVGLLLMFAERFGFRPEKLQLSGDIALRLGNTTIYVPVGLCIVLSVLLTFGVWMTRRR